MSDNVEAALLTPCAYVLSCWIRSDSAALRTIVRQAPPGGTFHSSPQSGVTFPQLLPHVAQWSAFSETILS